MAKKNKASKVGSTSEPVRFLQWNIKEGRYPDPVSLNALWQLAPEFFNKIEGLLGYWTLMTLDNPQWAKPLVSHRICALLIDELAPTETKLFSIDLAILCYAFETELDSPPGYVEEAMKVLNHARQMVLGEQPMQILEFDKIPSSDSVRMVESALEVCTDPKVYDIHWYLEDMLDRMQSHIKSWLRSDWMRSASKEDPREYPYWQQIREKLKGYFESYLPSEEPQRVSGMSPEQVTLLGPDKDAGKQCRDNLSLVPPKFAYTWLLDCAEHAYQTMIKICARPTDVFDRLLRELRDALKGQSSYSEMQEVTTQVNRYLLQFNDNITLRTGTARETEFAYFGGSLANMSVIYWVSDFNSMGDNKLKSIIDRALGFPVFVATAKELLRWPADLPTDGLKQDSTYLTNMTAELLKEYEWQRNKLKEYIAFEAAQREYQFGSVLPKWAENKEFAALGTIVRAEAYEKFEQLKKLPIVKKKSSNVIETVNKVASDFQEITDPMTYLELTGSVPEAQNKSYYYSNFEVLVRMRWSGRDPESIINAWKKKK